MNYESLLDLEFFPFSQFGDCRIFPSLFGATEASMANSSSVCCDVCFFSLLFDQFDGSPFLRQASKEKVNPN
jgi:hypothetical protein